MNSKFISYFLLGGLLCTMQSSSQILGSALSRLAIDLSSLKEQLETYLIPATKQALLTRYKPTEARCGAALMREGQPELIDSDALEFTCLLTGHKQVMWVTVSSLERSIGPIWKALIRQENIKLIEPMPEANNPIILFTQQGERNALLFAKFLLETKRARGLEENPYLRGTLLGYKELDIEFYYKVTTFALRKSKTLQEKLLPAYFYEWSEQAKKSFKLYETTEWLAERTGKKRFDKDKRSAQTWIDNNARFTVSELYKHIEILKEQVRAL